MNCTVSWVHPNESKNTILLWGGHPARLGMQGCSCRLPHRDVFTQLGCSPVSSASNPVVVSSLVAVSPLPARAKLGIKAPGLFTKMKYRNLSWPKNLQLLAFNSPTACFAQFDSPIRVNAAQFLGLGCCFIIVSIACRRA